MPSPTSETGKIVKANGVNGTGSLLTAIENDLDFRSRSLRGVDLLWLLLARGTAFNPVCCSTYTFDRPLDVDDLKEAIGRQCQLFPKYRQHLAHRNRLFHAPYFKDDPEFTVDRHTAVVDLPGDAGPLELDGLISDICSRPWDERRPLWDMTYVRNYKDGGGGKSALIVRGHHTQADGQGFIISGLYITSYGKDLQKMMSDGAAKLHNARTGNLKPSEMSPALKKLDKPWSQPKYRLVISVLMFALYWLLAGVDCVQRLLWSVVHLLYSIFFLISTIWRIEMIVPVQSGERKTVFSKSEPLAMSDVKTIQKAFSGNKPGRSQKGLLGHVTVNDVLCSIMADVIAAAQKRKPEITRFDRFKKLYGQFNPMPIPLFMPISLRAPGQYDMRNLSTAALAYLGNLPQASPTAKQIHKHIHKNKISLKLIKRSYLPPLAFHILQFLGNFPIVFWPIWSDGLPQQWPVKDITNFFLSVIISSMSVLLTNIPGPTEAVELEGIKTLRWAALPPQGGRGVVAIGVITYDGSVSVTAAVDSVPGYEDTARRICKDFEERFKLYLSRAEEVLGNA